jgi:hypothetical protein
VCLLPFDRHLKSGDGTDDVAKIRQYAELPSEPAPGAYTVAVPLATLATGSHQLTTVVTDTRGLAASSIAGFEVISGSEPRRPVQVRFFCWSLQFDPAEAIYLGQTYRLEFSSGSDAAPANGELWPVEVNGPRNLSPLSATNVVRVAFRCGPSSLLP